MSYSPVADLLRKSKEFINSIEKWTKNTYGRDANDHVSLISSSTTCKFCSTGAISKACLEIGRNYLFYDGINMLEQALPDIAEYKNVPRKKPGSDVVDFNDDPDTTHDMVMELFDKAIAKAEAISVTQSQSTETP